MPPLATVVSVLKHVKGTSFVDPVANLLMLMSGAVASPPSMFTSLCALAAITDFASVCQKVYFATEDFSDSTFLIVNTGLYNLFTEQETLVPDPLRRAEYRSIVSICQSNVETILANLPLFLSPKTENVQALLLGVRDVLIYPPVGHVIIIMPKSNRKFIQ